MTQVASFPIKASFRHVVFADLLHSQRHPVNFCPEKLRTPQRHSSGAMDPRQSAFVRWLFAEAGLCASRYREETIARRLPACLRHLRVRGVREAREALEADPSLIATAIGTLVIGVTGFFRDPPVFEALRDRVLPALMETRRNLRIWSVGCSDGHEIYSITMLLAEAGCLYRADLLGTDCRSAAIRHARRAVYSDDEVQHVPPSLRQKYLVPEAHGWLVDSRLRTVVQLRTGDVLKLIEPGAWDLILCRNCAMYLEPEAAAQLWEALHKSLRPGRILITGKAERPIAADFRPIAPCIFRKN